MDNKISLQILKEAKQLEELRHAATYIVDLEEILAEDDINNEKFAMEYIWQQGSHNINRYKEFLPTIVKLLEDNMTELYPPSSKVGRKVYRGILIDSDKELTTDVIREIVYNRFKNNKDDYFSVTYDLDIANAFAGIGQKDYIKGKNDYDSDKTDITKRYGVVVVMGITKGYFVKERDLDEREIITKLDYVTRMDIKYIYDIKFIKSTWDEISDGEY